MDNVRVVDIINRKRCGGELDYNEIAAVVEGFTKGAVPDYQMAAFMMATCINGMSLRETLDLTRIMINTGKTVDLSPIPGIKVDKHSTGGVGDTTTLIVAPLVAALGGKVAKMSGRGLGHTGGTLDKLESISGVCLERSGNDLVEITNRIGLCIVGQSDDLVPADKLMYALRDVTGTVDSIPLIASSIMSKKIASGGDAILLDVKVGKGAFMKTLPQAELLAKTMVSIGEGFGVRTTAIITDMNQPLGVAVGNRLEVLDAVNVLLGKCGKGDPLYDVSMLLAAHMLHLSGIVADVNGAYSMLEGAIKSGLAMKKLCELICELGGEASTLTEAHLPCVNETVDISADVSGYVSEIDPLCVGTAACMLGAGREQKGDVIDPSVGIILKKRIGDYAQKGESVATLYFNSKRRLSEAINLVRGAFTYSNEPTLPPPLVYGVIGAQK